jgi:hypothetical protein
MALKIATARVYLIDHLTSNTPYVGVNVSNGVNDSLLNLLTRRPFVNSARYQIHERTQDVMGIIVKHSSTSAPDEMMDDTVKTIKFWHEIETGWLCCTPPIIIRTEEHGTCTQEMFEPQEGSLCHQIGRLLAQKAQAMLEGRYDKVTAYGREAVKLQQQLLLI